MKPKMNFSLLKTVRELDTTQGRIARQSDISEPRFTRILRGYVIPTADEINRICRTLKAKPHDLGFPSVAKA